MLLLNFDPDILWQGAFVAAAVAVFVHPFGHVHAAREAPFAAYWREASVQFVFANI